MRKVSTAEAKPMVVKLGMTRKPTTFVGRCSFAERPAAGFAVWGFAIITAAQMTRAAHSRQRHLILCLLILLRINLVRSATQVIPGGNRTTSDSAPDAQKKGGKGRKKPASLWWKAGRKEVKRHDCA
jgi:hypothetical protein